MPRVKAQNRRPIAGGVRRATPQSSGSTTKESEICSCRSSLSRCSENSTGSAPATRCWSVFNQLASSISSQPLLPHSQKTCRTQISGACHGNGFPALVTFPTRCSQHLRDRQWNVTSAPSAPPAVQRRGIVLRSDSRHSSVGFEGLWFGEPRVVAPFGHSRYFTRFCRRRLARRLSESFAQTSSSALLLTALTAPSYRRTGSLHLHGSSSSAGSAMAQVMRYFSANNTPHAPHRRWPHPHPSQSRASSWRSPTRRRRRRR